MRICFLTMLKKIKEIGARSVQSCDSINKHHNKIWNHFEETDAAILWRRNFFRTASTEILYKHIYQGSPTWQMHMINVLLLNRIRWKKQQQLPDSYSSKYKDVYRHDDEWTNKITTPCKCKCWKQTAAHSSNPTPQKTQTNSPKETSMSECLKPIQKCSDDGFL